MTDTFALEQYAATRDPEAFAHLVSRYQQMVYATCLRTLGNVADAEDAAQETFVKLARGAGGVRSNVGAWLHRTATNVSINLIRSASRRRGREAAVAKPDEVADPAVGREWQLVREAVDETVGELPDDARMLVVQRYLLGRTQTELAAERGVSTSMMSRRMSGAVEQLRERLQSKGFGVGLGVLTAGFAAESGAAVPAALTPVLVAAGAGVMPAAAGNAMAPAGGLWLGAKVKLSTAILGSLGVHAVLVGLVLFTGVGDLVVHHLIPPIAPSTVTPSPANASPGALTPGRGLPTPGGQPGLPLGSDDRLIRVSTAESSDSAATAPAAASDDTTQPLPDTAPSPAEVDVSFRAVFTGSTDPTLTRFVPEGESHRLYLSNDSIVSGRDIVSASVVNDGSGRPAVKVEIDEEAGQRLYDYTRANIGDRLAIVVGGRVVSSPIIRGALRRSMELTGIGNLAEVEELAASINRQAANAQVGSVAGFGGRRGRRVEHRDRCGMSMDSAPGSLAAD